MQVVLSPILYMGNKTRLIRKGLLELLPKNINNFLDLFSGSLSVSLNVRAKKFIINDKSKALNELYELFSKLDEGKIIAHIKARIKDFKLPLKNTYRKNTSKEEVELYKRNYSLFRKAYNKSKEPLDLLTLMFFAFSQQIRFNKLDEFNMPFGNNHFSKFNEANIKNACDFFKKRKVEVLGLDFEECLDLFLSTKHSLKLSGDDFVYLDSPYSISLATYNERGAWGFKDDERLFKICRMLDEKGIKFGMSNVLSNRGVFNDALFEFVRDNKFNMLCLRDKFKYNPCGKDTNEETKEVFVCNYEVKRVEGWL